jgi:hypothetical protein
MRPHGLDAELAADDPKGLGQLRADVAPAGPRPAEKEGEVRIATAASAAPAWGATGSESEPPSASIVGRLETAYHASPPGGRVVSRYGPCGTARTSPPPWSMGANGPSAAGPRWMR